MIDKEWIGWIMLHDTIHDFLGSRIHDDRLEKANQLQFIKSIKWALMNIEKNVNWPHQEWWSEQRFLNRWIEYRTTKKPKEVAYITTLSSSTDNRYRPIEVTKTRPISQKLLEELLDITGRPGPVMFIRDASVLTIEDLCFLENPKSFVYNNLGTAYDRGKRKVDGNNELCIRNKNGPLHMAPNLATLLFMQITEINLNVDNSFNLVGSYKIQNNDSPLSIDFAKWSNGRRGMVHFFQAIQVVSSKTHVEGIQQKVMDIFQETFGLVPPNPESTPSKRSYIQVLMDLKRAGDVLQVYTAYKTNLTEDGPLCIFVSNDRLACILSDAMGVPTIMTASVSGGARLTLMGFNSMQSAHITGSKRKLEGGRSQTAETRLKTNRDFNTTTIRYDDYMIKILLMSSLVDDTDFFICLMSLYYLLMIE